RPAVGAQATFRLLHPRVAVAFEAMLDEERPNLFLEELRGVRRLRAPTDGRQNGYADGRGEADGRHPELRISCGNQWHEPSYHGVGGESLRTSGGSGCSTHDQPIGRWSCPGLVGDPSFAPRTRRTRSVAPTGCGSANNSPYLYPHGAPSAAARPLVK